VRDLFDAQDRKSLKVLLETVAKQGGVGMINLEAVCADGREAKFEMVVMPVIHAGSTVNRLLGCLTAIEAPYWLGSVATVRHYITDLRIMPTDGMPRPAERAPQAPPIANRTPSAIAGDGRRRFRVFEGGRS